MVVYAVSNGSGGRYDPADAPLYDWFRTETEAVQHAQQVHMPDGNGFVFRVDLGTVDEEKVISLMLQTYQQSSNIRVVHQIP